MHTWNLKEKKTPYKTTVLVSKNPVLYVRNTLLVMQVVKNLLDRAKKGASELYTAESISTQSYSVQGESYKLQPK